MLTINTQKPNDDSGILDCKQDYDYLEELGFTNMAMKVLVDRKVTHDDAMSISLFFDNSSTPTITLKDIKNAGFNLKNHTLTYDEKYVYICPDCHSVYHL